MADSPSSRNIIKTPSSRPLSGRLERAALLVTEDALSDRDIALDFGVARETVPQWRTCADISALVTGAKRLRARSGCIPILTAVEVLAEVEIQT